MDDLEKIEQELKKIENKLEKATLEELNELKKQVIKKLKHLTGIKNYLKKQKDNDLTLIRELYKNAKKIELQIAKKKNSFEQKQEKKSAKVIKESFVREEEVKLKEIMNMEIDSIEKAKIIKNRLNQIINHIEFLRREKKRLQTSKKEYKENLIKKVKESKKRKIEIDKDIFFSLREFDIQIKELDKEIGFQKNILSSYQSFLSYLNNKDKKANYSHKKVGKTKDKKENKIYYIILYHLLDDDKNYFFLKELLEQNPKFINARYDNHPIIFDILDKYIENLKLELVNQKIVHMNPNYYYSLLKLFRCPLLELSKEEEIYFQNKIEEFKIYLNTKGYSNSSIILEKLDVLVNEKKVEQEKSFNIDVQTEQEFLNSVAKINRARVNLTKEYLQKVNGLVSGFQNLYFEQNGVYPNEEEIKNSFKLPSHDIRNSEIILDTIGFENSKYAISFGFSKTYETFVRIHILDTALLYEQSPSLNAILENPIQTAKGVKKALKFKKGNSYSVLTYQIKMGNTKENSFKVYESVIKIDRVLSFEDIKNYRSDNDIKNLIGNLIVLKNDYYLDDVPISIENIENILDMVINTELKKYVIKQQLPILYFTELELTEEEKMQLHFQICYYLSKLSKKEANAIFKTLKRLKVNRYYGFIPLEESKIELDTKNKVGYLNSLIIKCSLHGLTEKSKIEMYQEMLENTIANMNQDDLYIDYFNERKLIRKKKAEEIETEKRRQDLR